MSDIPKCEHGNRSHICWEPAYRNRIAQLEEGLRVGIDVVLSLYSAPHPDEWIRTARNLLVPATGSSAETKDE